MNYKKEDQRVVLTKKMLRNALIELLKEKDIHKITVRELCDVADINRSTFYKHYENQFALLAEMEEELVEVIYTNINYLSTHDQANNYKVLSVILEYLQENREFSRLLVNNNVDPEFPLMLLESSFIRNYIEHIIPLNSSDDYYNYLIEFIIYGYYRVIQNWLNKENPESVKSIAKMLTNFTGMVGKI
ncbi:MAG: TetR family transcriptional regulator [Erysipelotrichaceae bacterium]|nr:TetR family transcriptional regulator [Erysipelotrichaceae bacterium]